MDEATTCTKRDGGGGTSYAVPEILRNPAMMAAALRTKAPKKAPPKPKGGDRNRGRILPTNNSGMAGIRFKRDNGLYVCVSYTTLVNGKRKPARSEFSVAANGIRNALTRAFAARMASKLPCPEMEFALAAYERFLKENPTP